MNDRIDDWTRHIRERMQPDPAWLQEQFPHTGVLPDTLRAQWEQSDRADAMLLLAIQLRVPKERLMRAGYQVTRWLIAGDLVVDEQIDRLLSRVNRWTLGEVSLKELQDQQQSVRAVLLDSEPLSWTYHIGMIASDLAVMAWFPDDELRARMMVRSFQRAVRNHKQHAAAPTATAPLVRQHIPVPVILEALRDVRWI